MTDAQTSAPEPMLPPTDDGPRGIGGWLVLPMIQLGATVVLTLVELAGAFADPDTRAGLGMVFDAGLPPVARDLIYFGAADLVLSVLAIVLAIVCLVQIVQTRRSVPAWMTAFYIFTAICYGFEWYSFANLPLADTGGDSVRAGGYFIGALVRGAIFIAYFHVSKRVKNTFVN